MNIFFKYITFKKSHVNFVDSPIQRYVNSAFLNLAYHLIVKTFELLFLVYNMTHLTDSSPLFLSLRLALCIETVCVGRFRTKINKKCRNQCT